MGQRDAYFNPDSVGGDGSTSGLIGANAAFASMSSCELNEQDDFITDEDNPYWHGAGISADSIRCIINGSILSALYNLIIEGDNNTGKYSESHYRLEFIASASYQRNVDIADKFVTVRNIQCKHTNTEGSYVGTAALRLGEDNNTIDSCILVGVISGVSSLSHGVTRTASVLASKVQNTLIYDFINGAVTCTGLISNAGNEADYLVYNTIAINCYRGFQTSTNVIKIVNCIAHSCIGGYAWNFATGSKNNLSDLGDAPGDNPITATLIFADAANDDYHFNNDDLIAIGAGIGPASDSEVPLTGLDGNIRFGATTDLGAFSHVFTSIDETILIKAKNRNIVVPEENRSILIAK